ncbi:hypothetical protein Ndes2526A_g03772 [Nannochloris sp. 'desiccata']
MAPLHANPMAAVMPHGIDAMVDPPPTSSHSRQPDWLRRHAPSVYVPPSLLSSLALEASRGYKAGYPTSCSTGTRLGDVCLILSAAGPARDLISLTQVPLQSSPPLPPTRGDGFIENSTINQSGVGIDAASLAQLASSGYRPWYTRANAPLLQLALNFSAPEGWSRTLGHARDLPIVAARSASSVEFWQLEQQQQQQREHMERNQEEEDAEEEQQNGLVYEDTGVPGSSSAHRDGININTKWKIKEERLGVAYIPPSTSSTSSTISSTTTTADVAWCHYIPTRCVVLSTNGSLFDVAVDTNKNSRRATSKNNHNHNNEAGIEAPTGWAPSRQLLSDLPFLENTTSSSRSSSSSSSFLSYNRNCISLRCAFTANHPRHVVVSLHSRLGTVDLRCGGGGHRNGFFSQDIYKCPPGQWISALATPSLNTSSTTSSSSLPSSCSHYLAASTATEILLFDLRRPHAALASWEHSMTAEGKVKDVDAIYAAVPDTLTWLPSQIYNSSIENRNTNSSGASGPSSSSAAAAAAAAAAALNDKNKVLDHSYQLVASNAFHGKAIVCEWNEHRTRGGIAAAKKAALWEYPLSKISKLTGENKIKNRGDGDSALENEQDASDSDEDDALDTAEYTFEPVCWTDIQPEQPPRLLFNLKQGYPAPLAAAVETGRDIQKHRATIAATTEATSIPTIPGGQETGRVEQEEGIPLQQQRREQQQQQQRQRAVRLLPSPWTGPEFLGISIIPLQQDWKRENSTSTMANTTTNTTGTTERGGVGLGSGVGGGNAGVEALLAMLSPTQELLLAQLRSGSGSTLPNNASINNTSTTPTTTAQPVLLQILNPVEPALLKERIDPGGVEEIRLDSGGRILEDPQITLAKEAAAGVVGPGQVGASTATALRGGSSSSSSHSRGKFDFNGGAVGKKKVDTYPQFNVKQPVYVGLSLHKWILEESIRQYDMDSEEYLATFPFPPPEQQQKEDEPEDREPEPSLDDDLRNKIQSLLVTSARVPFTAAEAWTALTSPTSQERNFLLLQGITPSRHGGSRKKRATHAAATSSSDISNAAAAAAAYSPTETFITALTRAGVVPLPPHIRAIPGKESNSTGLAALQSRAAFFPPLPPFASSLLIEGGGTATTSSVAGSTNAGQKLSVSTLNYRKEQLKAFAPPLTGANAGGRGNRAAGSSGQGTYQGRETGLQLPEIATEIDSRGHNVVFTPIVQDSGAGPVPLVHFSFPSKPPSAVAQTELTSGQDEYISSQIDHLRQAAHGVHRAAAPEPVTGSGGPWSAEHPSSHSPRSSNDEILFHNINTAKKDGTRKPVPTLQLHHKMMPPQASSGCLPEPVPPLNSSMSCDELLSMLDSVTNPGVVSCGHANCGGQNNNISSSKDANKDNTTGGSPVSRPRKRAIKDASSDGTDGAPMPSLLPPALRRKCSNNVVAVKEPTPQQQQQQQAYRSATSTPTPTPPVRQAPPTTGGQLQHLSTAPHSAPVPRYPAALLPQGHGSMPHLIAPQQTEMLAPSPFSATALTKSSQGVANATPPSQKMAPQVYHTQHHPPPAPVVQQQQQQQQHHYGGVNPPMLNAPLLHPHAHNQHHYPSATLPRQQPIGLTYPPPRQMGMNNGMPPPPMRHMSPTPYGNMMGMPTQPPPGWHNGAHIMPPPLPPHHRLNMAPQLLPQPHYMPTMATKGMAMMGQPHRRGPLSLTGVAPGMLPMHPYPSQYMTRAVAAPSPPPPSMQMSMHAAAAALAAAPVAVDALTSQKMPSSTNATIPVPSSLPPVRVAPSAAAGGGKAAENTKDKKRDTSLKLDELSLPPMPSAQLLADLPSLSPCTLLSPGGVGDPSTLSSLPLTVPHRDMNTGNDPFQDINHIHLSPEEFDAVLAAFDTPGLEDAQA